MSTTEDRTSGASGMAEQQAQGLLGSEVREGYAEVGDQRRARPSRVMAALVVTAEQAAVHGHDPPVDPAQPVGVGGTAGDRPLRTTR